MFCFAPFPGGMRPLAVVDGIIPSWLMQGANGEIRVPHRRASRDCEAFSFLIACYIIHNYLCAQCPDTCLLCGITVV